MLFPSLYDRLERARWDFKDIDYSAIDKSKVDEQLIHEIKHICLTEVGSIPATAMFMRDFKQDIDFQRFVSVWAYEEGKHSLVLQRWLENLGVEIPESEMSAVYIDFEPAPWIDTLTMHFLGEQRLGLWYGAFSGIAPGAKENPMREPVLRQILQLMAQDEWRHAGCYFAFLKEAVEQTPARLENIVKMTLWMLRGNYRHPTNITKPSVMDQLPDPGYFTSVIDRFVTPQAVQVMEKRVLNCISVLAKETVETQRDLAKLLRKRFGEKAEEQPLTTIIA
ncbi:MAG TPA: hypothetical protein VH186_25520 [Chloroflexia bacterium]|nr:hypothetical protein [Chloroflexia bacterium]